MSDCSLRALWVVLATIVGFRLVCLFRAHLAPLLQVRRAMFRRLRALPLVAQSTMCLRSCCGMLQALLQAVLLLRNSFSTTCFAFGRRLTPHTALADHFSSNSNLFVDCPHALLACGLAAVHAWCCQVVKRVGFSCHGRIFRSGIAHTSHAAHTAEKIAPLQPFFSSCDVALPCSPVTIRASCTACVHAMSMSLPHSHLTLAGPNPCLSMTGDHARDHVSMTMPRAPSARASSCPACPAHTFRTYRCRPLAGRRRGELSEDWRAWRSSAG